MIKSAVTASLVEEARGGPFVYWDGLADAFEKAAEFGFDAVEIFAPGPDAVSVDEVKGLMDKHSLSVAAVGTGAGMVKHGLSLSDASAEQRTKARDFVRQMIDLGGQFSCPAIIGSMQGRWTKDVSKNTALGWLGEALKELGDHAAQYDVPLIYEPLNRYETNLITTMADGAAYLESLGSPNAKLLADLFHMNIEEANLADALRAGGDHVGHVHFVDSNRRGAGMGHMDFAPLADALREIKYDGYACAEAFPIPDSDAAAKATIETFQRCFPR